MGNNKYIMYVAKILFALTLTALVYTFVVGTASQKGALDYAIESMEYPIARYYYTYGYKASTELNSHLLDDYVADYSITY